MDLNIFIWINDEWMFQLEMIILNDRGGDETLDSRIRDTSSSASRSLGGLRAFWASRSLSLRAAAMYSLNRHCHSLEVFPSSLQARYADLPASPAGLLRRFAPSGFAPAFCSLRLRTLRSRSPRAAAMYRLNWRCHSLKCFYPVSTDQPLTINTGKI